MMRLDAILCALYFGLLPWRCYERACHYAGMSYAAHLRLNLGLAWRWATFREDVDDVTFERETNAVPPWPVRWFLPVVVLGCAAGCTWLLSSCTREALFPSMADTYQQATSGPAPGVVVKKNTGTINLQVGQGNVATAAARPKAAGPVTAGEGNQAADSRRGPAVAGNGNTVTPPPAGWPWWVWAGAGAAAVLGVRDGLPWLWRRYTLQRLPRPS